VTPTLYTISTLLCMTVSRFLMQEREWAGNGDKQKALQKLAEAGFTDVDVKVVPCDIPNYCYYYYIARKSD
jgi:hypothetical protein